MSTYVELPIEQIRLDKGNPRIATYLALHDPDDITSDVMALLLGSTSSACEALRESIKENGGIIHPIVVNKEADGRYIVIEGNTRLQIYRDFLKAGISGEWSTIRAIVYDDLEENEIHSIRLQAHLVGPREWDSYAKAKYLDYLYNTAGMPMAVIIAYCGGSSKAYEIRNMIAAFKDMETYYRPLCDDESAFDVRKFQGFVEMQKKNIIDSLTIHGYNKSDFAKWIMDERISVLADVRRLPDILHSKNATKVFLKENSTEAKKILVVEEITSDKLKDVPYELLAKELSKRVINMTIQEIHHLRDDVDYANKVNSLQEVYDNIEEFVLKEIQES